MYNIIQSVSSENVIYYIDTDEIPGFLLLLKNHIFTISLLYFSVRRATGLLVFLYYFDATLDK